MPIVNCSQSRESAARVQSDWRLALGSATVTVALDERKVGMIRRLNMYDVLRSSVSDARFLILDTGNADGIPSIGGVEMLPGEPGACSLARGPAPDDDLRGGQRYVDAVTGLTLFCIQSGRGPLCYQGRHLTPGG